MIKIMAMSQNAIIGIAVVVVVLVGGFMLYQSSQNSQTPTSTANQSTTPSAQATSTPDMSGSSTSDSSPSTSGQVKEVTVTGSNFKFEPSTITVSKGNTVKITFNSSQGFHDFVLPDFNVQSKTVNNGQTDTVTFTADKTGSFQYFCSVGNHKALGMVGSLTVH
jgi:cytochrome c oxidase subunit 2